MKKLFLLFSFIAAILILTSFRKWFDQPVHIPASKQRTGNAKKGYEYLVTGDYVRSGIPISFFNLNKLNNKDYLEREGMNKGLSYEFTAVKASNGETVAVPNCLKCHAQVFNDQLIIGLGNSGINFTMNEKLNPKNFELLEKMLKGTAPHKYEAAADFIKISKSVSSYLIAKVKGVNSADRLAIVLAAHRDPESFKWNDELKIKLPDEVVPTDTPAWWLLKKKNAMFYSGNGRGDFGRFLMASNLLTVKDTIESQEVDEHMPDLLAYLFSLQPPKFPGTIDLPLAKKGKVLFESYCTSCHGRYGDKEEYPNLLVPGEMVGTDSLLYSSNFSSPQFVNWFNKSWFSTGAHQARLENFNGYIAPPLDGIWITAPYLHNGSVPNLETLLNSKTRPRFWSRDFDHPQYDYSGIGWKYVSELSAITTSTYNTEIPGYGNQGHTYGDLLTDRERKAIIEYLKTL